MIATLILFYAALSPAQAIKSICSTSQVLQGQTAFETCTFDTDISVFKKDFELSNIAWNESHTKQRIALDCHWSGSTPSCWNRTGDQYTCAVVPSEPHQLKNCCLYVGAYFTLYVNTSNDGVLHVEENSIVSFYFSLNIENFDKIAVSHNGNTKCYIYERNGKCTVSSPGHGCECTSYKGLYRFTKVVTSSDNGLWVWTGLGKNGNIIKTERTFEITCAFFTLYVNTSNDGVLHALENSIVSFNFSLNDENFDKIAVSHNGSTKCYIYERNGKCTVSSPGHGCECTSHNGLYRFTKVVTASDNGIWAWTGLCKNGNSMKTERTFNITRASFTLYMSTSNDGALHAEENNIAEFSLNEEIFHNGSTQCYRNERSGQVNIDNKDIIIAHKINNRQIDTATDGWMDR